MHTSKILVINPGSTSTKWAVFHGERRIMEHRVDYSTEMLKAYSTPFDQLSNRQQDLWTSLRDKGIELRFDAVIARGGLTHPIAPGVYAVNDEMLHDTRVAVRQHACNLGCHMAHAVAGAMPSCLALIADPAIVDEMQAEARLCGSPLMERKSIWHALNQRATARRFAREKGCRYEDLHLIIAHLGGGISIGAHRLGVAIDVNNALDGEGGFSPERCGTLPAADLVRLCFSGQYTAPQLLSHIAGQGGMTAWLGTNDMKVALARAKEGDKQAQLVIDAMIYHTAKGIAAQGATLCGKIDAILLTGGLMHASYVVEQLRHRLHYLAPIYVYAGENELEALAENALAVLQGERQVLTYHSV